MLNHKGTIVSEKVVHRIVVKEEFMIHVKSGREYNFYQGEISPSVPNLINRDFIAKKLNDKWLTDITEFVIPAGKVYPSSIVDCFEGLLGHLKNEMFYNRDCTSVSIGGFIDILKE